MGADLAFRKSYCIDYILKRTEPQGRQSETAAYFLHHLFVFRRIRLAIRFKVCVVVSLKIGDHAASDKFHLTLGGREIEILAGIYQRRTCYSHVHSLDSGIEQILHVVTQLCAANNRIIAENDFPVFQQRFVGDQFHLGHKLTALLSGGGEASGPGRRIFGDTAQIWHTLALRVAKSHTYA